jgi:hypothetical protein
MERRHLQAFPELDRPIGAHVLLPEPGGHFEEPVRSSLSSAVPSTITNVNGGCESSTVRATRLSCCNVLPFTLSASRELDDEGLGRLVGGEPDRRTTCGLPSALVEATCAVRVA